MVERDLGSGFVAVPQDAVTLNGMPLPQLNTMVEPYNGYWHVIAPNGRAVDDENGCPYLYRDIEEAAEDAKNLAERGEYSTCGGLCGGVVTDAAAAHTAGPWEIWSTGSDDNPSHVIHAVNGPLVAQTVGGNDEANAVLIAAAPDMFEALQDAIRLIRHLGGNAGCQEKAIHKATARLC